MKKGEKWKWLCSKNVHFEKAHTNFDVETMFGRMMMNEKSFATEDTQTHNNAYTRAKPKKKPHHTFRCRCFLCLCPTFLYSCWSLVIKIRKIGLNRKRQRASKRRNIFEIYVYNVFRSSTFLFSFFRFFLKSFLEQGETHQFDLFNKCAVRSMFWFVFNTNSHKNMIFHLFFLIFVLLYFISCA